MGSVHREIRLKQKDIVLLPVPFSDQSSRKVRPAIVVSNDLINNTSEDVILVPLTSVLKEVSYSIFKMKIGIIKKDILSSIKAELFKII
ncbi:type II toxin-antitoxin system PemK/MazF family toxin [Candidatus Woesearchaeota archaeon]|nr:type II toxin-antitoxin system PemK/MazF family toxin [Candidatus Woesearchaeota archaeon]